MSLFSDYLRRIIRRPDVRVTSSDAAELPPAPDAAVTAIRLDSPTISRRTILAPSDQLCAVTDTGRVRSHNEDQVRVSSDPRILIVADGMGGHMSGDVASALAATAVEEHLAAERSALDADDVQTVELTMLEALEAAQERVLAAGQDQERNRQMGSTLILGLIHADLLLTCHVGDVRGYVWNGMELKALTRDHSVVAELVAAGQLAAEQAHLHAAKNQVLQAVGMHVGFDPDLNRQPLKSGDRVLLCSDGLWEMLSNQEIASIVGGAGSMAELATQLVDRANDAGGRDNISVILYEHLSPDQAATDGPTDQLP